MSILLKLNSNRSNCLEHSITEEFFFPREQYFITDTELLALGDKKKADRLLVDFIIVLKFSTHNEPFLFFLFFFFKFYLFIYGCVGS